MIRKCMIKLELCAIILAVLYGFCLTVLADEQVSQRDYGCSAGKEETIVLQEDLDSFVVSWGAAITLDLNGHSIANKSNGDAITVEPGAMLVMKGEGVVSNTGGGSLIFNEGECFLLDNCSFVHDAGGYAVINHGYMEIRDGVEISSLRSDSSLIENGYYNYESGDARTGFVSGWKEPELYIQGGDFNGGRINVKNDERGICKIYGGAFHDADEAVLKNWGTMDIYGGEFYGADHNIVLGIIRDLSCYGDLRIHDGSFKAGRSKALFSLAVGNDADEGGDLHGEVELLGGEYEGFHYWYSSEVSPGMVIKKADNVKLEIWARTGN